MPFPATVDQLCRDVQPSLTLAAWCDEVYQRWQDLIVCSFSRRWEDTRGGYVARLTIGHPHTALDHTHCSISNHVELWVCLRMLACQYTSLFLRLPACHLMLLYSTSSCEQ